MTAHYFLGSRLLGSTEALQTWDGACTASSMAYFCHNCGDVWGRVVIPNKRWMAVSAACPKCPTWNARLPGSFMFSWHHTQLNEFPPQVVQREFDLHMNHLVSTGVIT